MMRVETSCSSILIVKLADLGDVLLSEPAIRSLRAAFPDARIDILVPLASASLTRLIAPDCGIITFPKHVYDNPRALLLPTGIAAAVRLAVRLRRARYDRVVILHHLTTATGARKFRALALATGSDVVVGLDNGRGSFLTHRVEDQGFGAYHEVDYALAVARLAGGSHVDRRPAFTANAAHRPSGLPDRYVALFPATGPYSSARSWPVQGFVAVAGALVRSDTGIVIAGADDACPLAQTIMASYPAVVDLTGRTNLEQLAAVVDGALAVVGGDTFVGHLASALNRPLVSIFGPSNADAWRPYTSIRVTGHAELPFGRAIALDAGVACSPCLYTGFALGRRDGCPSRTCMSLVTPMRVVEALNAVIAADGA